MHGETLEDELD